MRPTFDEIRRAAYERWERRGWNHGGDRDDWCAAEKELTFHADYRAIAESALEGSDPRLLGDVKKRRCRFCERTAGPSAFGGPRPIVADREGLLTAEVCDDCQSDWRGGLEDHLRDFWARLRGEILPVMPGRSPFTVAAFKAMTAAALLIAPAAELRFFGDTLEWVSNPDHDSDDQLLDGAGCCVYRAPFLGRPARATLVRRRDDERAVPYMLIFLEADGIMVQAALPMCLRDEDLDGQTIERPERVPCCGHGHEFRDARGVHLPLSVAPRRGGRPYRLPAVA